MSSPNTLPVHRSRATHSRSQRSSRIARKLVMRRLESLSFGELRIIDTFGANLFGEPGTGPTSTLHIHEPSTWAGIALGGSLAAGEHYMEGHWTCTDLVAAVRVLLRASERLSSLDGGGLGLFRSGVDAVYHRFRSNTRAGSRRNIAEHYDLGNDFYRLWLDESMMYSAAIWERPDMSLEQAQHARLERICRKLELGPDDHLLEIGTGWGGLAIHAASRFGCRVTTTTISREQYELATERVRAAGLQDRVTVLLQDYRDLNGTYDKLVSIEMIEAVGAEYLQLFFAKFGSLLAPDGLGLIQAITIPDDRFLDSVGRVDFIKRYIFPGGQLPSLDALSTAWRKQTDLRLLHMEDFGAHYARTLNEWRKRFHAQRAQVEALGYSKRFQRMWDFYLASCEAAFIERHCGVAQLLFARPEARREPIVPELSPPGSRHE
jgi:cyclopropane-fatty-acyl-phospholipid synthase